MTENMERRPAFCPGCGIEFRVFDGQQFFCDRSGFQYQARFDTAGVVVVAIGPLPLDAPVGRQP